MLKTALIGAGAGVAALLVIGSIVIHNGNTINLNKYVTIESSGYNGYGSVYATSAWDAIEKKYGSRISFTSDAKKEYGGILSWTTPIEVLQGDVDVEFSGISPDGKANLNYTGTMMHSYDFSCDKTSGLSNGDVVTVTIDEAALQSMQARASDVYNAYAANNWDESETLDELYKAVVTKNMDAFNHEDNVTENV